MANSKYPEKTYEQLLAEALDLLHDVQYRLGMFEKQDYWKIKLRAESLKTANNESDGKTPNL